MVKGSMGKPLHMGFGALFFTSIAGSESLQGRKPTPGCGDRSLFTAHKAKGIMYIATWGESDESNTNQEEAGSLIQITATILLIK